MQQTVQQSAQNWKQSAMLQAEKLTDVWDVIKAWLGRGAEIVLSICMFASIIGVLPGIHYWPFVDDVILSVQIIMLDMGGFALNSLAKHARECGQEESAIQAERMGSYLINLVILTLGLITVGQLAGIAGPYASFVRIVVGYAETVLILVRVVSTVAYIHTIHSLRGSTLASLPVPQQQEQQTLQDILARIDSQAHTVDQRMLQIEQGVATQIEEQQKQMLTVLSQQVQTVVTEATPAPQESALSEEAMGYILTQLNERLDVGLAALQRSLSKQIQAALSEPGQAKPLPTPRVAVQEEQPGAKKQGETREQVRALRAEGLGVSEIAAKLGKTRQAIYNHIRIIEEEHAA